MGIETDNTREEIEMIPLKIEGPTTRSAVSEIDTRTAQHQKMEGTTAEKDIGNEQKNTHNERTNIGGDDSRPRSKSTFRMERFQSVAFRKAHSPDLVPVQEYDKCIVTKIYRKKSR